MIRMRNTMHPDGFSLPRKQQNTQSLYHNFLIEAFSMKSCASNKRLPVLNYSLIGNRGLALPRKNLMRLSQPSGHFL